MSRCPECGEAPAYTSFCTRCAKLFRRADKKWDQRLRKLWRLRQEPPLHSLIKRLHSEGLTANEAAARLNISTDTVNRHRRQLELTPFAPPAKDVLVRWSGDEIEILTQAIKTGVTGAEAAELLGRTLGAVRLKRHKLGLPCLPRYRKQKAEISP